MINRGSLQEFNVRDHLKELLRAAGGLHNLPGYKHLRLKIRDVERWAVAAEEIGHDKPGQSRVKHFAWLCAHEQQITARALC